MTRLKNARREYATEETIDPRRPICDPHHHFWQRDDDRYTQRRYLLDELLEDTAMGHNLVKTVFVECGTRYHTDGASIIRPTGETAYVAALAADSRTQASARGTPVVSGIVGYADLTKGEDVVPLLEAHIEAGGGLFRGIRQIASWDTSSRLWHRNPVAPGLLLEPRFRRGFAYLNRFKLSFDAWLYHHQLPDLVDLAAEFPDTTIVLDHVGGPLGIGGYERYREGIHRYWRHYVSRLAAFPNVHVKLGGLGMPLCGFGWHTRELPPGSDELARTMAPWFDWCIQQFGSERCMFESNFPVDKESCTYHTLWNAFKKIARSYTETEKDGLFHDNACRVYRLGTPV